MQLRFRLPADDREDEEVEDRVAHEEPLRSERARGRAIVALGVVAACQILWPLPAVWVVLFGAIGAVAGLVWLLEERGFGLFGGLVFFSALQFFTPPQVDPGFIVRTAAITFGVLALVQGVGVLIKRAWEAKHGT